MGHSRGRGNEVLTMEATRLLLDEVKQLTRDNAKLMRRLGRCAWHRNQAQKAVARMQDGLRKVRTMTTEPVAVDVIDRALGDKEG